MCSLQVAEAVNDSYKRLLKPSIETEFAGISKEKADEEAIRVFAGNLRQLLLAPPLGQKRVIGIDLVFPDPDVKSYALTHKALCCITKPFIPHPPKSEYQTAGRKAGQIG